MLGDGWGGEGVGFQRVVPPVLVFLILLMLTFGTRGVYRVGVGERGERERENET